MFWPVQTARQERSTVRARTAASVVVERCSGVEDALDDAPRLLDRILSGEQSRIAVECVADEALVGVGSVAAERFAVVDGEIDALGTEACLLYTSDAADE